MKKSFFVKSFAAVCATSFLVSVAAYNIVRIEEPKVIDFSAFKNASANLEFITSTAESTHANESKEITERIVNVIDKEIKTKIKSTRYAMMAKKKVVAPISIAKNWNDIKPNFESVDLKIESVKLNAVSSSSSDAVVSEFEINNKELIKLYGFKVESIQFDSFANTQIALIDDMKSDVVQVAQASTTTQIIEEIEPSLDELAEVAELRPELAPSQAVVKLEAKAEVQEQNKEEIIASDIATNANPINDELVVYDYSEKSPETETPKMKKIFDAPISNTVKEAIERESHKTQVIASGLNTQKRKVAEPTVDESALEKLMDDEDNQVYDYSNNQQASVAKKEEASAISAFTAPPAPDLTTQVEFTIKAREINLNTLKARNVIGYEFVPDYDRAERMDDQASGEIKLGYSLTGEAGTITGVVQSQDLIPTRVELNLLNKGMNIPMLNERGIQKFLEEKQAEVMGNLLMVAVDPSIVDVEIDSDHQFKLFLSEKFKLVGSQTNASYVLFLGVRTGNISIRYLLSNKESAQKIVYVGDGEMYFEDPDFVITQREMYTFTTRSLLGKKVKELNINGSDISFFGTKTTAKKKALNAYEIKVPELVENSRKYLEFKHLGNSLFVGTDKTNDIEIPGNDFIKKVLEVSELSDLGSRCMVQLNLTKDLRDIKANGKNKQGEMFVETTFLDNDGNFSRDNSELSEKVFVSGDMEGMFNIRLDYTDGTTDFLKTFCSEGSYIIEQL